MFTLPVQIEPTAYLWPSGPPYSHISVLHLCSDREDPEAQNYTKTRGCSEETTYQTHQESLQTPAPCCKTSSNLTVVISLYTRTDSWFLVECSLFFRQQTDRTSGDSITFHHSSVSHQLHIWTKVSPTAGPTGSSRSATINTTTPNLTPSRGGTRRLGFHLLHFLCLLLLPLHLLPLHWLLISLPLLVFLPPLLISLPLLVLLLLFLISLTLLGPLPLLLVLLHRSDARTPLWNRTSCEWVCSVCGFDMIKLFHKTLQKCPFIEKHHFTENIVVPQTEQMNMKPLEMLWLPIT